MKMSLIGEIATEVGRKAGADRARVYSVTKYDGFVPSDEYFNKQVFSRDVSGYKLVETGTFAYATIHLDEGSVGIAPETALISPMYTAFKIDLSRVEPRYLLRLLKSPRALQAYAILGEGSANRRRSIPFKRLAMLEVPVPTLNEQRRIVDILDKTDGLRTKRRESIAHLDALGQSIFHQMFLDDSEQTATLGDILKVSSGKFLPAKSMTKGGEYPVYGGNGITGFHDQYTVEEPTVVIGRVGAKCGAVHLTKPKSWITDNALLVKKLVPLVDEYLLFALRQADLNQYANVSGQPSVSGASLYRVPFAVPRFELQQEFARRIATVENLKEKYRVQLDQLDELFLALQDRAFKGEL